MLLPGFFDDFLIQRIEFGIRTLDVQCRQNPEEDEQEQFEAFLQRLREAKDKQEFDAFMDDRAKAPRPAAPETEVARSGEY